MMLKVLLVVSVAASALGGCWSDSECALNERCNLRALPRFRCLRLRAPLRPWSLCVGRENCCGDGYECRGRFVKSCQPLIGECEAVEQRVCDGKARCLLAEGCDRPGHICIADPDDRDRCGGRGGPECGGCCVPNLCLTMKCNDPDFPVCTMEGNSLRCVECEYKPGLPEWKKGCNTCYCGKSGSVLCTKKACPPKVCDRKAKCGGIQGLKCLSRSQVCIDDPDDDCDPANGGADCGGCCVYDMCQNKQCCSGKVCELNAQGKAECVPAPLCEAGSTWKEDCNTCTCVNGRPACTRKACLPTRCTNDEDCSKDRFCRQEVHDGACLDTRVCVKKVGEGERCNGFTLPCFFDRCQDDLVCKKAEPTGDVPGTCVPDVCEGKTKCRSKDAKCPDNHVCIDDPTDDCDPEKDGADCEGCCVADMCKKTECCKEEVCKLDSRAKAQCVPRPKCREGTRWKKDCNTCYCRGGNVVCTKIACPPKVCDKKARCGGIQGLKCPSRSQVCIDDPDDDCDPANGGADCGGCCVHDMCQNKQCCSGKVCELNAQGKAECVPAPLCEAGSTWKEDCNTCTCVNGRPACTRRVCLPTRCTDDEDCPKDRFCRQAVRDGACLDTRVCVKKVGEGERCNGFTLPCFFDRCQDDLVCKKAEPTGDVPGTCVPDVCEGKTKCRSKDAKCPDNHVCIDDPTDDCDPEKDGADCEGCCVADMCKKTECCKEEVCKLDSRAKAQCVPRPKCREGTRWKKDCNTCYCRGGNVVCTKKACPKVCDKKAKCGGIRGLKCPSRSQVCIDDPDDDCDPANGGADCGGCCVHDMCQNKQCCSGKVCELNAQGKAECAPAPLCEAGSTWKDDCNTCSCVNGRPICTLRACTPTRCTDDEDCPKDRFCRQEVHDGACLDTRVCVKKVGEGERCNGFTLPCFFDRCQDDLVCKKAEPTGDVPGTCVPDVCEGKTKCRSKGAKCPGRHLVCIDDPTDDCDPEKDGADCEGCCVADMCKKTECCKEEVCKLDSRAKAQCVPRPKCREGTRWKKDCNTCYCRGGNVVCTEIACPPKVCDGKAKCHGWGGFAAWAGMQCASGHVCIDDPDDDCDPTKNKALCNRCCVYNMCLTTKCSQGHVCKLDEQGKSQCVPIPQCREGARWKKDCNTCYCKGGKAVCTEIACDPPCKTDADCAEDEFCRPQPGLKGCLFAKKTCVKRAGLGETCSEQRMLCRSVVCQKGLQCHTDKGKSTCVEQRDGITGPNACTPYTEEKQCLWWQCYNAHTCSCMKDNQVNCFVDPCQVADDCTPGYTCKSSYCGGCNHQCVQDP